MATKSFGRIVVAAALLFLILCPQSDSEDLVTPRPAHIPLHAVLVAGADGGVYVSLRKLPTARAGEYRGSVFEARTGILWFKGRFKLVTPEPALTDLKNADVFLGWDGDALLLRDGRKLVAQRAVHR